MFDLVEDTIAAVATAPGLGARGIVRCSGTEAVEFARQVFTAESGVDLSASPGFRRFAGVVVLESDCKLPAEVYLFRAPRSYTRQDCVEFHLPGSPVVLGMLLDRLVQLGARHAQAGEFTARALMAGAMDLTQVEAVAGAIHARSDAQLRAARRMASGELADRIEVAIERLGELVALIEADIDFAEEPIEFITPVQLGKRLTALRDELGGLLADATSGERIDVLPQILLIGRSNAGKSTLMNRLSGMDRAICSPVAGTTRDVLSAPIDLGRSEAVLLDAAGVDSDPHELNYIRRTAGATTSSTASDVDLLCLVVDLACDPDDSIFDLIAATPGVRSVVVGNKIDLLDGDLIARRRHWLEQAASDPVCLVSAGRGDGVDACRRMLADALKVPDTAIGHEALVVTVRQREALEAALSAIDRCIDEAGAIGETIDRADILAFELREALEALGSIVGSVTTDDLLRRIFASFCIGK